MIFWDHNAGAPVSAVARAAINEALTLAGNPSSVHAAGRAARKVLDEARTRIAETVGCLPRDVVFTGSGSEGAALAMTGAWETRKPGTSEIVLSGLEHPCVSFAATRLEARGATLLRVPPGPDGRVDPNAYRQKLSARTALATLMWVNNETGVVQPVPQVARQCAEAGVPFISDAVQGIGKLPGVIAQAVPGDAFFFSGHKLGTPPGIGALIWKGPASLPPLIPGHQERGRRGGTLWVGLADALSRCLAAACQNAENEAARLTALRDAFERRTIAALPAVRVNGGASPRVGNTSNLRFPGVDGEALLIALDLEGICVSSGAACASGSVTPSPVLTAMGLTATEAQESLRFSLGPASTAAEVDAVIDALTRLVPRCRAEA